MNEHKWEFGQWGRVAGTHIVWFIGTRCGRDRFVYREGNLMEDGTKTVEYLPDCTGFDWKPSQALSEHKWEFGDWAREHGYLMRYVGMNEGMLRFIWPDGSTGRRSKDGAIEYLPDCTGWDWKPKPKYRPFANGEELKPFRDKWVRWKGGSGSSAIVGVSDIGFSTRKSDYRFSDSLDAFEFEDGTPFGMPVSEGDK